MKVVIYGAGSIGCYIGAVLFKQGVDVQLLGRQRLSDAVNQQGGVHISDYEGRDEFISSVPYQTNSAILQSADIVLVTLKCTAMKEAAEVLAEHCKPGCIVVCLQNGVGSEQVVMEQATQCRVYCGIVPFNVVQGEHACFHRATEGALHFPDIPEMNPIQQAYLSYGLPCELEPDMPAIIWGKLLLNLNNAINALSDLPLKTELSQRGYRLVLARCQEELLAVCKARNIKLAQLTAVKPHIIPKILKLPDFLFRIIAQKMLAIDPKARSSMWEDLQAGRETEIDFLNGAVVTMAESVGMDAPVNRKITSLLKQSSLCSSSRNSRTNFSARELQKALV
ncbi:2-dehydropantoate 2-reductase [Paraneptunicella aestuarii]|uniref:2-dehydropantoate 2-reductase n=1 Tax=Paraneptunicella aestuarii TaxID=2831148 RepID=UPI001E56590F|nr:2-dehydropantoate 2-reductase [Paraneptunicella aestuarii]UAA39761.1 2-dehydropantoate 2-reductase [Paraneptunicella aestuarii]